MAEITSGRVGFHKEGAVNIKIDRSSPLGNPFKIREGATRDQVCDQYRDYLADAYLRDYAIRGAIRRIEQAVRGGQSVNLQCWCFPKRCHGGEIKAFIEELLWK